MRNLTFVSIMALMFVGAIIFLLYIREKTSKVEYYSQWKPEKVVNPTSIQYLPAPLLSEEASIPVNTNKINEKQANQLLKIANDYLRGRAWFYLDRYDETFEKILDRFKTYLLRPISREELIKLLVEYHGHIFKIGLLEKINVGRFDRVGIVLLHEEKFEKFNDENKKVGGLKMPFKQFSPTKSWESLDQLLEMVNESTGQNQRKDCV